ncbi:33314_t:CDS:1, partial [Gigaspora margarita]
QYQFLHTMDKSKQISDIYYNPWIDLNFDQNNQQAELDALPIKEIPIEPEAVQFELLQLQDT